MQTIREYGKRLMSSLILLLEPQENIINAQIKVKY